MLEKAEMCQALSKEESKAELNLLKNQLSGLQHRVKNEKLSVLILFDGWSTAGKGSVLSNVILTLDPRNFKAKSTLPPTEEEKRKPFLWRHWKSLPERGIMGLYDKSWYPDVIRAQVEERASKKLVKQQFSSINTFERQLADDGTLILKFFLHISKKEQKKRLDFLASKKETAWRVSKTDYKHNKRYDEYYRAYDHMLATTDTEHAPWHVVAAQDKKAALVHIYQIIVDSIGNALAPNVEEKDLPKAVSGPLTGGAFTHVQMPDLSEVHLEGKTLSQTEYKACLKPLKKKLKKLHNELYLQKIPLVIGYEGWDAAGKGGNIRRLTSALDPRGYEVVPIASPTPPEMARQYLWRFWTQLPKDGHITIFDRTWYGRVMVERVEGFATDEEWKRAYREINEFESDLHHWGAIVLKFWLQISKEEQLRRFEARQNTPEKQWKITDEDWRNREKWDAYEIAVNDMLRLTSTDFAPWMIVESEDKRYGRIKVLQAVIEAIESRL